MVEKNPLAKSKKYQLKIGITIGDFNGIGPEIIIKALEDKKIFNVCVPVIYGSERILTEYKHLLKVKHFDYHLVNTNNCIDEKRINVINCWFDNCEIQPGKSVSLAGRYALSALDRSTEDLRKKVIDAVVTCPINKYNIQSKNFNFSDHTQYYTEKFGKGKSLMLMCGDEGLKIGVLTGHIPLSMVSKKINKIDLLEKINIIKKSLKDDFGILKPKIAILGLNPHAGEKGLLGTEEEEIIKPVIIELGEKENFLYGPFPADGFFSSRKYKKFDVILAMYHDQGLIPFKSLTYNGGVNYTAGLSIVRTSPAHGTAYDIAGKGIANENSLQQAIFLACDIVRKKKKITNKLGVNTDSK